jgi:hypothetical protein
MYNRNFWVSRVAVVDRFNCTDKPWYNGHPWDPKIEIVFDRWLLFRGRVYYKN